MPLTEAQRRAQQKYKEANKERLNAYRLAWRKSKEGYIEKQRQYKKAYNQKQFFLAEVRRLLDIQII